MRALIVEDGLSRQALAAARALRDDGWTVGIGSPERSRCVAARSRAVSHWHHVPSPETSLDGFLAGVVEAISRGGYELVFGARDFDVAALSFLRERIPAVVPYAEHKRVMQAQDKRELARLGELAGFPVPSSEADVARAFARWPAVIVKPSAGAALAHGLDRGSLSGRSSAVLAGDAGSAERAVEAIRSTGDEPILQEALTGRLMAFVVLADCESRIVASVQQCAERTWPHDAGISVRARTTPVDHSLGERTQKLVSALGWFGIAQLQFLVDEGGEPHLIDFNGRFYGSLALACAAGANLPAAWARLALGRPNGEHPVEATLGVRYQWLWGDLVRAVTSGDGHRAREVAGCLRYASGAKHSVLSVSDPLPAARYLAIRVGQVASRLSRGGRSTTA